MGSLHIVGPSGYKGTTAPGLLGSPFPRYMGFELDVPGLQVAVPLPATTITNRGQGDLGRRTREGLVFVTVDLLDKLANTIVPPHTQIDGFYSKYYFLVPKMANSLRPILDLRRSNKHPKVHPFWMLRTIDVFQVITQGEPSVERADH
jgi:hypothetical protein